MPHLRSDEDCEVCGRCALACGINAIRFEMGRINYYPVIDETRCIECGDCERACNQKLEFGTNKPDFYIGRSKSQAVFESSSSGGIFTVLARNILGRHGVIFGAEFCANEGMQVRHIKISDEKDIGNLKKSKYVQSNWISVIEDLKQAMAEDKWILFTGTPCQAYTVKTVYGEYPKLFIMDLFCHGVSCAGILREYLEPDTQRIDFRAETQIPGREDRTLPDDNFTFQCWKSGGAVRREHVSRNIFMRLFVESASIKKTCIGCRYAAKTHMSDITVGDFDKTEYLAKENIPKRHQSIIAVNTRKGQYLFDCVKDDLDYARISEHEWVESFYKEHLRQGSWGYDDKIRKTYMNDFCRNGFQNATINFLFKDKEGLLEKAEKKVLEKEKECWLYGAGPWAKNFYELVKFRRGRLKIPGFVVSGGQRTENSYDGLPIYEIKEIRHRMVNDYVVVAVGEKHRSVIVHNLREIGITGIITY